MDKLKTLKIFKEILVWFVMICQILFKGVIFFIISYLIGYTAAISSIDNLFYNIFLTMFMIGGIWWVMKDYIIYFKRKYLK